MTGTQFNYSIKVPFRELLLDCKPGAAFNATAGKNFAAVFRGVALHETVLNFALTLMRLISAFWHKSSISIYYL